MINGLHGSVMITENQANSAAQCGKSVRWLYEREVERLTGFRYFQVTCYAFKLFKEKGIYHYLWTEHKLPNSKILKSLRDDGYETYDGYYALTY